MLKFADIDHLPKGQPGLYEVHTCGGIVLKVGIAADLRKRLRQHLASRQDALKLKPGGNRTNPSDVLSKQSILAKHLYYDELIAPDMDLTQESERRRFLMERCEVLVCLTRSRPEARELERSREVVGDIRYVGRIKWPEVES